MKKIIFLVGCTIYLGLISISIYYIIIYPNSYVNIFAFINNIIASSSALFLGFLTVYQSKKYKEETDIRENTPIIVMTTSSKLISCSNIDIEAFYDESNTTYVILLVCSLNKTISNFLVNRIILKKDSECVSNIDTWTHRLCENSTYNGIFLPNQFYNLKIHLPKAFESSVIELEFTLNNVYSERYKKIAIFKEKNGEWFLDKTLPCTFLNN